MNLEDGQREIVRQTTNKSKFDRATKSQEVLEQTKPDEAGTLGLPASAKARTGQVADKN